MCKLLHKGLLSVRLRSGQHILIQAVKIHISRVGPVVCHGGEYIHPHICRVPRQIGGGLRLLENGCKNLPLHTLLGQHAKGFQNRLLKALHLLLLRLVHGKKQIGLLAVYVHSHLAGIMDALLPECLHKHRVLLIQGSSQNIPRKKLLPIRVLQADGVVDPGYIFRRIPLISRTGNHCLRIARLRLRLLVGGQIRPLLFSLRQILLVDKGEHPLIIHIPVEQDQAVVKVVAAVIGSHRILVGQILIIPVGPANAVGRCLAGIEGVGHIV